MFLAAAFAAFLPSGKACDLSGFSINGVSNLGNNRYKLDVTFCCGSGRSSTRYGADQSTTNFAFYLSKNATLDGWSDDSLISPITGHKFRAYHLIDSSKNSVPYKAQVLYYIGAAYGSYWTCISNTCGTVQSLCKSISIYTIGLPDTVWCRGMEAAGNVLGGCVNLKVFPKCYVSGFAASAGSPATVYISGSPNCATLSGSASGGTGSYTYAWNTGASTSSITVCPTSTTTYNLTVTDGAGCKITSSVKVTASCARSSLTANAGADKTVYNGTSPNCATLSGVASGGLGTYSYKWSTGATTTSISVCPTATTNYSLIVTDGYGCKDTDLVNVTYKDIRCGSGLTKLSVCYQGSTYCINSSQLGWYTSRGATLGACGSFAAPDPNQPMAVVTEPKFDLFPNPASNRITLSFTGTGSAVYWEVYDLAGSLLFSSQVNETAVGRVEMKEIQVDQLKPGMYIMHISATDSGGIPLQKTLRFVIQ